MGIKSNIGSMEQKRLFSEVISLEISWLKDDPIVQLGPKLNTKIALNHHHPSTGNFSNGSVPDIIGGRDSVFRLI